MSRGWLVFLLSLSCSLLCRAQADGFDTTVNHYNVSTRVMNDASNGFSVEYKNWYKVVTNHILNETYALVCCGQSATNLTGYHAVINTPVTNIGITSIRDALPYIELLGLRDAVKSVEGYQNVTSPCYSNVTDSPGADTPQVIFTAQTNTNLQSGPAYVGFSPNTDQLTPLQQASWLVFIALFFDAEAEATTIFSNLESVYNCHKSNMAEVSDKKDVAWTFYDPTTREWALKRDAYYNTLVTDAGAMLVQPNDAQSAEFTSLAVFHTAIGRAQYVIDTSDLSSINQTYDGWLNTGGFTTSSDVYNEAFISDKNVYRTDGLVNTNGYSDWPQRSPARPDLALQDVIHMIEPTYQSNYSFTWMRNFAKSDNARQIADTTYLCDAHDIFNATLCEPHPFGSNQTSTSTDTSSHLSKGGKAGISVGVIVFVLVVAVVAYALYRQCRQTQGDRPFYRMKDMK